MQYRSGHYAKRFRVGPPRKGTGYLKDSRQRKYEHTVLAEKALGHPMPDGALVHHFDGNRRNNVPGNMVICPDHAYHMLLHLRQRALAISGHADWRKCVQCKAWDDLKNMDRHSLTGFVHRACDRAYQRRRRVLKAEQAKRADK